MAAYRIIVYETHLININLDILYIYGGNLGVGLISGFGGIEDIQISSMR